MQVTQTTKLDEARRYLENAREILDNIGEEFGYYTDDKPVREAGHTAWIGILFATEYLLDAWNPGCYIPYAKSGEPQRPQFNSYLGCLSQLHRELMLKKPHTAKLLAKAIKIFRGLYDEFHKSMGYDGKSKVSIISQEFLDAYEYLSLVEKIRDEL